MAAPVMAADSRLDFDVVTPTPAEDPSKPVSNLSDDRPFSTFRPTSAALTVDIVTDAGLGNSVSVDYLALVVHDLDDPDADGLGGVDLEFSNSFDGISFTPILTITPVSDPKIIFRTFTLVADRFFRLRLTRAPAFLPSIGQAQWGKRVQFPFGIEVGFDPQSERIGGQLNRSQSGNILGAIRTFDSRENRIQLPLIPDSFMRDLTAPGGFQDFWDNHARNSLQFFFSWNPGNPGLFEKDAYFAVIDPRRGIARPLRTQLATGFRDLEFSILGFIGR